MTAISGIGLNDFLMASSPYSAALKLRAADGNLRAEMQRKAASQGGVVTDVRYTVGPDGQLYATDATVVTSRKVQGNKTSLGVDDPRLRDSARFGANDNQGRNPYENAARKPESLNDLLTPRLNISPFELALLQEKNSNENSILSRLQMADAGVRTHERQHFFSAGGLVSGTPEYEYAEGPDGQFYAVAGRVDVSATPTNNPEKASRDSAGLYRAATAPGDASSADLAVARGAYAKAASYYTQANRLGMVPNMLSMAA